jgi:hypothetical protein
MFAKRAARTATVGYLMAVLARALTAALVCSTSSMALAQDGLRLEYLDATGASGCPNEEAFREIVAARLGRAPFDDQGSRLVRIVLRRAGRDMHDMSPVSLGLGLVSGRALRPWLFAFRVASNYRLARHRVERAIAVSPKARRPIRSRRRRRERRSASRSTRSTSTFAHGALEASSCDE